MIKFLLGLVATAVLILFSSLTAFSPALNSTTPIMESNLSLYESLDHGSMELPSRDLFELALNGYTQLSDKKLSKSIITIIDFSKASTEKRLWSIDLNEKKVLFNTWVAHGQNSGNLYAESFSNKNGSHQSSLGFYTTGQTYQGKHGLSLKLHGLEKNINDQAEARAIVMHGADYVSEAFIKRVGRLGRSHGCPAIPMELHKEIISTISGGSLLFIYYPDEQYLSSSIFASYSTFDDSQSN